MRANIHRIDLTQSSALVDTPFGSSWLDADIADELLAAPRGRTGLWDAMAKAIEIARAAARGEDRDAEATGEGAHLAYLASVADERDGDRVALPGAAVVAIADARARNSG